MEFTCRSAVTASLYPPTHSPQCVLSLAFSVFYQPSSWSDPFKAEVGSCHCAQHSLVFFHLTQKSSESGPVRTYLLALVPSWLSGFISSCYFSGSFHSSHNSLCAVPWTCWTLTLFKILTVPSAWNVCMAYSLTSSHLCSSVFLLVKLCDPC